MNPVIDTLISWQPDASTIDSNQPVANTNIGIGTTGDLNGELRRIKSELRGESLLKGWERWKNLLNLAGTQNITFTFSQTNIFTVNDNLLDASRLVAVTGRRVKAILAGGVIYGTIVDASFSSPNTIVTVAWDSGVLDATLNEVQFGPEPRSLASRPLEDFRVRKTGNENLVSSTVLQPDNELFANGIPAGFYDFDMQVVYQTPPAAGIKVGVSVSAGAAGLWTGLSNSIFAINPLQDLTQTFTFPGDGTIQVVWIKGTVTFVSALGIFQFVWAQGTADPSPTGLFYGSTLVLRRFA